MARKNLHMDDLLARGISAIRHAARRPSETDTINRLLEGAIEEVEERSGFVYLARSSNPDFAGLVKIGYSAAPLQRMKSLALETKGDVEPLEILSGSRLLEIAAHVRWAVHWVQGEWFSDSKDLRAWFAGHPQRADMSAGLSGKSEILSVAYPMRLKPSQKAVLDDAADASGMSVADILRTGGIAEARRLLRAAKGEAKE